MKKIFLVLSALVLTSVLATANSTINKYVSAYTGCNTDSKHLGNSKYLVRSCGVSKTIVFSKQTRNRMMKAMRNPGSNASLASICPSQAAAVQKMVRKTTVRTISVSNPYASYKHRNITQVRDYGMDRAVKIGTAIIGGVSRFAAANQIRRGLEKSGDTVNMNNSNTNSNTANSSSHSSSTSRGGNGGSVVNPTPAPVPDVRPGLPPGQTPAPANGRPGLPAGQTPLVPLQEVIHSNTDTGRPSLLAGQTGM